MTLTARRIPGVIDQIGVYDGHVRIAILADSQPAPIILKGELPKGVKPEDVAKMLEVPKNLKGGLS